MEPVRINKYLAQCGVCSRREADKLIEDGVVTINRLPAASGQKVTEQDEVAVHGTVITVKEKVVLAYYKPIGVVVTQKDTHAERTVIEEIDYPEHLTYAGRLDKDSEGLLLLTNDGDLIHGIMKGGHFHEKEYEVTLMATSYKTVTVRAESEDEASLIAMNVYNQTDLLNFTDDDVDEIAMTADEIEK